MSNCQYKVFGAKSLIGWLEASIQNKYPFKCPLWLGWCKYADKMWGTWNAHRQLGLTGREPEILSVVRSLLSVLLLQGAFLTVGTAGLGGPISSVCSWCGTVCATGRGLVGISLHLPYWEVQRSFLLYFKLQFRSLDLCLPWPYVLSKSLSSLSRLLSPTARWGNLSTDEGITVATREGRAQNHLLSLHRGMR